MKAYRYTAYSSQGKTKSGVIIAETEGHATELLKADGLFVSELSAKPDARSRSLRRARLSADMRAVFTRQMAVLLAADLPSDAALEAVRASGSHAGLEAFAADTKAAVLEGQPLSDALAKADPGLPRFYTAVVRAGETSGELF